MLGLYQSSIAAVQPSTAMAKVPGFPGKTQWKYPFSGVQDLATEDLHLNWNEADDPFHKTRASKAPGSFLLHRSSWPACNKLWLYVPKQAPILSLTNQAQPRQMRRQFFKLICNQVRLFFLLCLEPMYFNNFKPFPIFTSPSFLTNAGFYLFLNIYSLHIYSKSSGDVVIWYSPVFWSKNGVND